MYSAVQYCAIMTGVDFTAKGETIDEEGQFDEAVYYSDKATANILSFASQIDACKCIDSLVICWL